MLNNIMLGLASLVGLALIFILLQAWRKPVLAKMGLRNIPRRPMQSALIILGLTLSTTIIISALSIGDTLNRSAQRQAVAAYGNIDEILSPPIIGTLTQLGLMSADQPSDTLDTEQTGLLAGGVETLLTLLQGGLPGISQARYDALEEAALAEPLIDGVAPAIIFPTIIRDTNSGQSEPFGFIFAVDDTYQTQFGLTTTTDEPAEMSSLRPGVGNVFELTANLFSLGQIDPVAVAQQLNLGQIDLSNIDLDAIDLAPLGLGVGTLGGLLAEQGLDGFLTGEEPLPTLEDVGLEELAPLRDNPLGVADDLLATINLNTLGTDIDNRLGQLGLSLRQGDVYLNQVGAAMLNAREGDVLEIYIGPVPLPYRVKGIVTEAGPMSAISPVAVMSLDEAQRLLFMTGKINAVLVSNQGDALAGMEHTVAVNDRLKVLVLNDEVVAQLAPLLREKPFLDKLEREINSRLSQRDDGPPDAVVSLINQVIPFTRLSDELAQLQTGLQQPGLNADLRQALASRQVQFWLLEDENLPSEQAIEIKELVAQLSDLELLDPLGKQTVVNAANVGGLVSSSIFSLLGIFSILAGMLLIFMIFVMLAAERRSEMGMARAIGVQRRHLIQMFVTEGVVYDLISSAIGVGLGLAVSYAMIGFIGGLFNDIVSQISPQNQGGIFQFEFTVVSTSVIIAYCLGVLLTFIIVTIASWRISRLNIVAAIRDLPERSFTKRQSWWGRHWSVLLGLLFLAGGLAGFWSGELEVTRTQLSSSLLLAGVAFILRWLLARTRWRPESRDRLAYSILGLGLLTIWIVPWSTLISGQGALFEQDPRTVLLSFALTGPLLILGAILAIMFNADALLWLVSRFLGGIGPLTPVLKTAIAYPLHARFRTGVAMLLFAMIITTVTIMAVIIEATQTTLTPAAERYAGFDVQVSPTFLSFFNPINDLAGEIAQHPDFPQEDVTAIARQSSLFTEARQTEPTRSRQTGLDLTGLNVDYLEQAKAIYGFQMRAAGYETDKAVWQALQERDDVVIVSEAFIRDEPENSDESDEEFRHWRRFHLSGITLPEDPTQVSELPEIWLELQPDSDSATAPSEPKMVQVIGVLAQDTPLIESRSLQVNEQVLAYLTGAPVEADYFYVKVSPTAEARSVAQAIERDFLGGGLNATVMAESFASGQAITRGILQLFQGFMSLGLLVGIAALGVISSRTVVERRQQVGVLRAIGYQPHMVALIFVLESSFIALCGLGIGAATGLILGQNMVAEFYSLVTDGQAFAMPWGQIGLILLGTYLFAMLTTIVPAYQASRIYPAEALRYS